MSDQDQARIKVDRGSISNTFQAGGNIEGNTFNIQQYIYQTAPAEREKVDHVPETILIPAGSFLMGTKEEEIKGLIEKFGGDKDKYINETPQHEVSLPAYRIGKYLVTNLQYKEFVDKTKGGQTLITRIMGWNGLNIPHGKDNLPVTGVTWYQALAYCQWLNRATGRDYQLPNEAQWEKACQYTPDFVGNIRQWTCSLWGANFLAPEAEYCYPWKNDPMDIQHRNDLTVNSQIRRVVRGSSFKEEKSDLRCTVRGGELPETWVAGIGFRVVTIEQS